MGARFPACGVLLRPLCNQRLSCCWKWFAVGDVSLKGCLQRQHHAVESGCLDNQVGNSSPRLFWHAHCSVIFLSGFQNCVFISLCFGSDGNRFSVIRVHTFITLDASSQDQWCHLSVKGPLFFHGGVRDSFWAQYPEWPFYTKHGSDHVTFSTSLRVKGSVPWSFSLPISLLDLIFYHVPSHLLTSWASTCFHKYGIYPFGVGQGFAPPATLIRWLVLQVSSHMCFDQGGGSWSPPPAFFTSHSAVLFSLWSLLPGNLFLCCFPLPHDKNIRL